MNCEFYIPYVSLDDIPKEKFKDLFKEYWYAIYELELEWKPFIYSSITGKMIFVLNDCFACEYARRMKDKCLCYKCPLVKYRKEPFDSIYNMPYCTMDETFYSHYTDEQDPEKRSKYALEIAKLRWEDIHEN